jgi:hypothetical protein
MRQPHSLIAALLILLAGPALAEWPVDGIVVGERVYQHIGGFIQIVPDGAQGVIALTDPWHRATRVDPQGATLWSVNPYAAFQLADPSFYAPNPRVIAADGIGGYWMACWDTSTNVVALHFDASGVPQGDPSILCENLPGLRYAQTAVPDARGGVFVLWPDERTGDRDICASHVDALGIVNGPANGLVVFGGPGAQLLSGADRDGRDGLLVVAPDALGATVQRFDADLDPMYGSGVRLDAPEATGVFAIAATGDGGAFVAWPEGSGAAARLRVQRLDANGLVTPGWPAEGVIAALAPEQPISVHVLADGTGGACVAWRPAYAGQDRLAYDVRVSRVLANGRLASGWPPAGVVAGGAIDPSLESRSILVADGAGGCYLAWADLMVNARAMYAQHVAHDGSIFPGWPGAGLRVGGLLGDCQSPAAIPDGAGGAYVGWDEYQYPSYIHEAHVIHLSPGGPAGEEGPRPRPQLLSLTRVAPNPARGLFTVNTTLPDDRPARLELFDLSGRLTYAREVQGAGEHGLTFDSSSLAPGLHWMSLHHPTGVRTVRIVVVR